MAPVFAACALAVVVSFGAADPKKESFPAWSSDRCQQKWSHFGGCVVDGRGTLPEEFDLKSDFEVTFLRHPLWDENHYVDKIEKFLKFSHSQILFQEKKTGGRTITLGFWAKDFGIGTTIPAVTADGRVLWQNEASVGWFSSVNMTDWPTKVAIGSATGGVINAWLDWVAKYDEEHQQYLPWSVWDSPMLTSSTQRYFDETICHSFTEAGLKQLYTLGADFTPSVQSNAPLCRNYLPFIGAGPVVDIGPIKEARDAYDFFNFLNESISVLQGEKHPDAKRFEAMVRSAVKGEMLRTGRKVPMAYILSGSNYFRAVLKSPFFANHVRYLNQRMILPWQDASKYRANECDEGNVDYEFRAGQDVGNLTEQLYGFDSITLSSFVFVAILASSLGVTASVWMKRRPKSRRSVEHRLLVSV